MASDPNKWFDLWDTFGSIFRSDGAATTKLQLSNLAMGELESLCGAAGIPVLQLGGGAKKEKMVEDLLRNLACFREAAGSGGSSFGCKTDCVCVVAAGCATCEAGSSSSSGPQRSTHQSSQQLEDEAVWHDARLARGRGSCSCMATWGEPSFGGDSSSARDRVSFT
eukprot:s4720_g2.t1